MDSSKPFYLSASFWGVVIGVLGPLAAKHGITLDPTTIVPQIIAVIGGGIGIWGVLRRKDITLK